MSEEMRGQKADYCDDRSRRSARTSGCTISLDWPRSTCRVWAWSNAGFFGTAISPALSWPNANVFTSAARIAHLVESKMQYVSEGDIINILWSFEALNIGI
jgi:hypothetical protein